jgi:hypothetical protein
MSNPLDNLCGPGKQLQKKAPDANELAGLLRSGTARLKDARNATLALESQFDLAYNAAHSLSLAALRRMGLRLFCGSSKHKAMSSQSTTSRWPMPSWRYAVSNCAWHWVGTTSPAMWCGGGLGAA